MLNRVLNTTAAGFDRVFARALLSRSSRSRLRSRAESLGHAERLAALEHVRGIYDRPEHYQPGSAFFPEPVTEGAAERRIGRGPRGAVVHDLVWPSEAPAFCEDVAERFAAHRENGSAAARVFSLPGAPRPAVILVHGYRAGQYAIEARVWPIEWLLRRGFDVALAVLPLHAVRAPKGRGPQFPSSDPRITNEAFRQAVTDLRALARLLRERGASEVGIMGMSLGGYTAALVATLEAELSFAVPMIPLASLADMAKDGGRFVGTDEEQDAQHAALEAAHRVVSPLARPAVVPSERLLVIAGEGDRITPRAQAEKLAGHFDAPLETFAGGHILQFGRAGAFRAVGRMLRRLGY